MEDCGRVLILCTSLCLMTLLRELQWKSHDGYVCLPSFESLVSQHWSQLLRFKENSLGMSNMHTARRLSALQIMPCCELVCSSLRFTVTFIRHPSIKSSKMSATSNFGRREMSTSITNRNTYVIRTIYFF
jgi:hypothetical protein